MSDDSIGNQPVEENLDSETAAYDYSFDLISDRSASRVARLVGRKKTVLEVGCGPGSQSKVFHEQLGCDVVGVEIDPERARRARAYCRKVHVANLETDKLVDLLRDEKFDVVVCSDVLEHLRLPETLLIQLNEFIKPNGYLVASIPNVTHASIIYGMIHGRFEYGAEGLLDSTHVRLFSCSSALSLLESSGYWISELQKAVCLPQHTEFQTKPITIEDQRLLSAIIERNPDAQTYQFIIKAHPIGTPKPDNDGSFFMREKIRQLQSTIRSYETELQRLNSIVDWYQKSFVARFKHRIGKILDRKAF